MEYIYKFTNIFILLIQTLLLSVSSLQAKEISSVDTKVLRTQQVFEELTLRAVNKGNLRNNSIVGILKTEVNAIVPVPRYVAVMDNALQMILSAHTQLADRSLLKAIDQEQELMLKRGKAGFAGTSMGVLSELDFFAWASFDPLGSRNVHVRVTIADANTGVVRSMAFETLQIPEELQLSEEANPQEFQKWKVKWEDSKKGYEFSRQVLWIGVALLTTGVIIAPCEERSYKDDRQYNNFVECNRNEAGRLFSTGMFIGFMSFVTGGTSMLINSSSLTDLEKQRELKEFPALSFWHKKGETNVKFTIPF